MERIGRTAAFLILSLFAVTPARAQEVVCDFEKGLPAGWTLSSSGGARPEATPAAELRKYGNNTVLRLSQNALMTMGEDKPLNFSLEASVRREYDTSNAHVGFQFRNGYRAYLRKPGQIELTGPGGAMVHGFSRNMLSVKPLTFKIVVVGPTVRFFVNGRYEGQFDQLPMTPGPVALYQRDLQNGVYFDDVKLSARLDPAQSLVCDPETGDDKALVFDPAQDIHLKIHLHNYAAEAQRAAIGVSVSTFDDKPVLNKSLAPVTIEAGGAAAAEADLGRIPAGFYRVTLQPTGKTLPLAVQVPGAVAPQQIVMPKILTGVYWYHLNWELPPVWAYTYMHAASNDLRAHHFNTIICSAGMPTDMIEIAGRYGIRCFTRGEGVKGNVADPNVIGGFLGDEPHPGQEARYLKDYAAMTKKYPDRIWTTCMIGDGGVAGCQSWWDAWMPLSDKGNIVRMMRWYGIKGYVAGISRAYGTAPTLTETLRGMSRGAGPYYFIMPSFGNNNDVDAYFSNPLPSQIRCMMHLAAAFQARGLFFWTYQNPFPDMDALVDPATLLPMDGKWAAAGDAAAKIQKNADLLAQCAWAGRYRFVDGPALLEVFQLSRKDDPAQYFYAVNTDTEQTVGGRIFKLDTHRPMTDLFTGKAVPVVEETVVSMRPDLKRVCGVAKVNLAPGDGVLLKYAPLPGGADGAGAAALPRVAYPAAVANAPADKVIWLADVKPLDMPHPGWIPEIKYKGKQWYPDYNSHDLKLYSGPNDAGQLYKKSLYAHAETDIKYAIPVGAATFAAAAGFGNQDKQSSAIFRVLVDGKEQYNSGVMRLGSPVQPVVVELAGGKQLELVTEEAGDGLHGDYCFWGEARLIRK